MYDDSYDDTLERFGRYSDYGDEGSDFSAATAGTGYALYRHGQDRQAAQIADAMQRNRPVINIHLGEEEADGGGVRTHSKQGVLSWSQYVGQERMKRQLRVHIDAAKNDKRPLDHVLLASGQPGCGKSTIARIIANEMGGELVEVGAPIKADMLARAISDMQDGDVLFIDEIHMMAPRGGDQVLLTLLEDGVLYVKGVAYPCPKITVIGATTDASDLADAVIDRFSIRPFFEKYSMIDMIGVVSRFISELVDEPENNPVSDEMVTTIARASAGVPRDARRLVLALRDMRQALGNVTPEELLDHTSTQPDGLKREHVQYLTTLLDKCRTTKADGTVLYRCSERRLAQMLRQPLDGIEPLLIDRGYIEFSPGGRVLTDAGIDRALDFEEDR